MKSSPAMAVAIALLLAPPVRDGRLATPDRCAAEQADQALGPSRSLYCIDLIPVPDFRGASGPVALLRAARSPFTVAVDADGHHEYELEITLRNLPDPRSLGQYTTYVAWATPPGLSPEVKLGE